MGARPSVHWALSALRWTEITQLGVAETPGLSGPVLHLMQREGTCPAHVATSQVIAFCEGLNSLGMRSNFISINKSNSCHQSNWVVLKKMLNFYGWQGKMEFVYVSLGKVVASCRIMDAFTHSTWVLLGTFLSHSLVNAWFRLVTSIYGRK